VSSLGCWAVAEEGDVEDGIARVRVGVRDLRATGAELRLPHYLGILADLYRGAQRLEDAIVTLAEARAVAQRNGEHWSDASLHLLEGDLALAIRDQAEAERLCLPQIKPGRKEPSAKRRRCRNGVGITNPLKAGWATWMLSRYFLVSKAPCAESSKAVATVTDSQRLYSSSSELSFSRTKWRASAPSARRSGGTSACVTSCCQPSPQCQSAFQI
jgi:hypothetical protein